MKKILLLLFILFSMSAYSQGLQKYQATKTSQAGGRYEIVQSEIQRSQTFKLDKYTGKVYMLVTTKSDEVAWEEVQKNSAWHDTVTPDKVNYQLFLGGSAARDCFLLNINTGATWILVKAKDDSFYFENFE